MNHGARSIAGSTLALLLGSTILFCHPLWSPELSQEWENHTTVEQDDKLEGNVCDFFLKDVKENFMHKSRIGNSLVL